MASKSARVEERNPLHSPPGVFGGRLKFSHILLAILATLLMVIAAAGVLFYEVSTVKNNISGLEKSISGLEAIVDRMNVAVSGNLSGTVTLLKEQTVISTLLGHIESASELKTATQPSFIALTSNETDKLRAFFQLARKTNSPQFKLGDKVSSLESKPMPEEVYIEIAPALKGTNFTLDNNGALVVTSGTNDTVVLIVNPA